MPDLPAASPACGSWPARWPQPAGSAPASPAPATGELAALRDALGGVHDQDLTALTEAALAADTVALAALAQAAQAELVRRVAELGCRGTTTGEAALPTAAWLRRRTGLSRPAAGALVRAGQRLAALPATTAALGAGAASVEHVRGIAAAVDALRQDGVDEPDVGDAERVLAEAAAAGADPERLRREGLRLRHALAPQAVVAGEVALRELRYLHLRRTGHGLVHVEGMLDPVAGAFLHTALDALMQPNPAAKPAGQQLPRTPTPPMPPIPPTPPRRAGPGWCWTGGPPPASTSTSRTAWSGSPLHTLTAGCDQPGTQPAELVWTGPISGEATRRLLCDARITRVITDPQSMPLDVGRTTRTVPPWMFAALVQRDNGCAFPACGRPPEWCDAHHLVFWSRGGPTSLTNSCLLCEPHHHAVHEGGWSVSTAADGRPCFTPPAQAAA